MMADAAAVTVADIERAARAGAGVVRETPVLPSHTLTEVAGAPVLLKAENLQGTGSFKLRGAVAKIASLGPDATARGVVCGSAGNHAQAVAYAARSLGVPCEVFMPEAAPIAKVEGAEALGAVVHLVGVSVDESLAAARARAREAGMAFVHPFDDVEVIAGQGGIGLELLAQVPDLARVIVPVGGGGLISGIATAVRTARPQVQVIGVQAATIAPFPQSLRAGEPVPVAPARTIADGIAVKRPGDLTLKLIGKWVSDVVTVTEDEISEAMVYLMERVKLVVEGAGAVGVAALLSGRLPPLPAPAAGGATDALSASGTTVIVLSGGNVDAGLLADVARHNETRMGRRLVLRLALPDRPGSLVALLTVIAAMGANVVDVQHIREGLKLHIEQTAVQLVLQTRGPSHAAAVEAALREHGYEQFIA